MFLIHVDTLAKGHVAVYNIFDTSLDELPCV